MSDNPQYEQIHFATITNEVLLEISPTIVGRFKSMRTDQDDEDRFKNDEKYQVLKKDYYRTKKEFEDYKFNIRNNQKN